MQRLPFFKLLARLLLKPQKSAALLLTTVEDKISIGNVIDINKYSNLFKLFRVTSYVLRFINNIKKKIEKMDGDCCDAKYPSADEMRAAHNLWVKANQLCLSEQKGYKQSHTQLNCAVDAEGVVCSYGRMKHAKIPEYAKAPVLLCKKHR